ncbi:putative lanthionine synthetase C [Medicago truncatula]|uniref:G protein coupled receptor n=1 Tax=Medicago truncatula TaxID=3880 RepID=G7J384_MEDTR|nr:lanC-like protein GCL1 [Medicago truncatula]AES72177.1 G protein coupled receptor [Medicago truncatula]RHN69354.1 putative lanthionine synthetase C [Medicago truncatula]
MTSSVIEGGHDEAIHEPSDLIVANMNPTVGNLSLPNETFLKAAISLKDEVVEVNWNRREVIDPTVYTGLLGTAFTCLRSYEVTGCHKDLVLSSEIIDTCATVARDSLRHVTFLCGRGGLYALGAVVANYMGDLQKRDLFLGLFMEVANERALPVGPEEGGFGMSYDLLYGRAGFLWAALFLNKHLGEDTVSKDILMPIIDAVLAGGRAGASDIKDCPLMYRWHGTRYLGAANGLAGILHVLIHFPLPSEYAEDVKGTLRYLISKRFPHSGNYPSSEGNPRDKLVQWSHGATGMAITLSKAAQVFPNDRELRDAAIEAGEVVWKNGLVKKVGLADGVSGNAYAFLSLYKLTKDSIYEERAKSFSCFLYDNARALAVEGQVVADGNGYSLFHGLAGTACLWFDLIAPDNSRFPGYEL